MYCFLALFVFAPILSHAAPRIVGGMDADPQRYPYYAAVERKVTIDGRKVTFFCGGSLM
jgi:secreted trypsin-like serine protease